MQLRLGVDTLCWHLRLESGAVSLEEVLDQAAELGAECVQLSLHHARDRDRPGLEALRAHASDCGLPLFASGNSVGRAREGDRPEEGVARVERWLQGAIALGSPILRIASGFYRADLADRPDLIEAERRYVVEVLRRAAEVASAAGVQLALENHSDFTAAEYRSIMDEVGTDRVGVFLDLVNPISAFEDPVPVVEALAPYARAGHVKDVALRSIPTDDGYHRRGFEVLWRYPGEGMIDLPAAVAALRRSARVEEFFLMIEGLDNRADVDDQRERLAASLALLREL